MDLRTEIISYIKTLLISKMISKKVSLLLRLKKEKDFIIELEQLEKIDDFKYKDLIIYLLHKNNYWN